MTFECIQELYDHLNDCVLRIVEMDTCSHPIECPRETGTNFRFTPFENPLSPSGSLTSGSISSGELSFIAGAGSGRSFEVTLDTIHEGTAVLALEAALVYDILEAFAQWKQQGGPHSRTPSQTASESTTASSQSSQATSISLTFNSTHSSRSLKRFREDDGDGSRRQPRKQSTSETSTPSLSRRILACPYAKFD